MINNKAKGIIKWVISKDKVDENISVSLIKKWVK